ncbi:sigma-70 family RNA polymerase sigma factor [bacterium]|nr:sigma-70 family RNA polymerase sigma factor [bacterium]
MEETDTELMLLARTGDEDAFRRIVERHQGTAYSLALRILGRRADAEDAVQEAFIRVWRHLHRFDTGRPFQSWLNRITANVCLDRLKSADRKRTGEMRPGAEERLVSDDDPARRLEDRDLVRWMERFIPDLPPKQRMVFVLRDVQDMSVEETAEALGMSRRSVISNLCLGRKTLAARFEALEKVGKKP